VGTIDQHIRGSDQTKTYLMLRSRRGRDSMIAGYTSTCVISAYHHWSCEFESWQGVLDTTLCDKVCQRFAVCQWFSPGYPGFLYQ